MVMKLVGISDEEAEKFVVNLTSADTHIMFDTTYYCDLMCPHCHYACTKESDKFMSESDIYAILSKLNEYKFKIPYVAFSGGEITTIEEKNPGYVKHVLSKSLEYGFPTTLMTNGSFITKPYAERVLNDLCDIYTANGDMFNIQMPFDMYHKNCIANAHNLISVLDEKLENDQGIKYPFYLMGFKHDPKFKDNFSANPKHINVFNKLAYDLNPIGRARENDLPGCRDTYAEFLKEAKGDKLYEMTFTPINVAIDQGKYRASTIMIFDCNGYVRLADRHNPENYNKFKIEYKKPDNTIKSLPEMQVELGIQLLYHFFGKEK